MKKKTTIQVFRRQFTLLLVLGTLSACASLPENLLSPPNVALQNVQILRVDFSKQTFLLSFDVANPNSFALPVKSVGYGVKLDGQRFASGETESDFTVPANGSTQFAISVDLNLLQTAPQLLSIVRDAARGEIPYELEGEFAVNIPFAPPLRYASAGTIQLTTAAR